MDTASELIERMERETGQRVDCNDGDNFAIAGLMGALFRAIGNSRHQERDDVAIGVAIGVLLRHSVTDKYKREQVAKETMAEMIACGLSPDDCISLFGGKNDQ